MLKTFFGVNNVKYMSHWVSVGPGVIWSVYFSWCNIICFMWLYDFVDGEGSIKNRLVLEFWVTMYLCLDRWDCGGRVCDP